MSSRIKNIQKFIFFVFLSVTMPLFVFAKNNPQICDYANLLTEDQKNILLNDINSIKSSYEFDVVLVTTNSLNGKSAQKFAEDFYTSGNYGVGSEKSGILFLVAMNDREYWTLTHGYGIYSFTDYSINYINSKTAKKLSDGKYFEAFKEYLETAESFLKESKTNKPYDTNHTIKTTKNYVIAFVVTFAISAAIAFLIAHFIKKGMKVKNHKSKADEYIKNGSFNLTNSSDLFLYSNIITQAKSDNNDSSSKSGSSTHSNNDTTFGGGGGSF